MKKILLLICLTGSISLSIAQSVKFGIKGGINFASLTASGGGYSVNSSNTTGFHLGFVADIGLSDFSIQPGIFYSSKGGSGSTLGYIEVPVNLLYNVSAGEGKLFFGAGPYLGYGVSGSDGATFGSGPNDISNPDYGIDALVGYRFTSGFALSAGSSFGLADLNSNAKGSGYTVKNRVYSLSVGYFF